MDAVTSQTRQRLPRYYPFYSRKGIQNASDFCVDARDHLCALPCGCCIRVTDLGDILSFYTMSARERMVFSLFAGVTCELDRVSS